MPAWPGFEASRSAAWSKCGLHRGLRDRFKGMWRSLALPALGVVLAAGTGCSSPLREYVCATDTDCFSGVDIGLSRCESSGHCSDFDPSCVGSGFRFGEGAGSETGDCVGEAADTADAGPGSSTALPVASIVPNELDGCQTNLEIDGSDSEASDGATLTNFSWTLRNEDGALIDAFEGAPGDRLSRGTHRLGGTLVRPNVNFPDYHGSNALQAGIDGVVRTTIFQRNLNLEGAPGDTLFRLFFSVGAEVGQSAGGMNGGAVRLRGPNGEVLKENPFALEPGRFVGHQFDFSLENLVGPGTPLDKITLEFEFSGDGVRWLDNVAIVDLPSGLTISQNESAENLSESPWLLGDGDSDLGGLIARNIVEALESKQVYTLELQVTDSNGQRSAVDTLTVFQNTCP